MDQLFRSCAKALDTHARENNLIERGLEACDIALRDCELSDIKYKTRPLGGWPRKEIQKHFVEHCFVFKYRGCEHGDYLHIDTLFHLSAPDPDWNPDLGYWPIGTYRFITLANGEYEDDILLFDSEAPTLDEIGNP
ncbi:MAG: hypothetical protein WKG03_17630 [Telluria sp.]